jgi:hypothetical protein
VIHELGALVEEQLGRGWFVTVIPFGASGGFIEATGSAGRVVIELGKRARAASTLSPPPGQRGPHFGLRWPSSVNPESFDGYHFDGDVDWSTLLRGREVVQAFARLGFEIEAVGTRLRANGPRLGEWQLHPFVESFLHLRALVVSQLDRGQPQARAAARRARVEKVASEALLSRVRASLEGWDGRAERKGAGIEGRVTLPGGLSSCAARVDVFEDVLRLAAELPSAVPAPILLTPQRGLLGWLRSFGELELGVAGVDPRWIIDAPAEARALLRSVADALAGVDDDDTEVRLGGDRLDVRAPAHQLRGALELWRRFAEALVS